MNVVTDGAFAPDGTELTKGVDAGDHARDDVSPIERRAVELPSPRPHRWKSPFVEVLHGRHGRPCRPFQAAPRLEPNVLPFTPGRLHDPRSRTASIRRWSVDDVLYGCCNTTPSRAVRIVS